MQNNDLLAQQIVDVLRKQGVSVQMGDTRSTDEQVTVEHAIVERLMKSQARQQRELAELKQRALERIGKAAHE